MIKALATKSDNLNSILGTRLMERKTDSCKSSSDTDMNLMVHLSPEKKINITKKGFLVHKQTCFWRRFV